jgi:hypothetical protein
MMRRVAALGLVLGVLVGLGVLTAGPAAGCSCAATTPAGSYAGADVVFAGTVVDAGAAVTDSAAIVAVVFDVTDVRKGQVGPRVGVLTAASDASCGLGLGTGQRAVIFAKRSGGVLTAGLCGGVAPIDTLGRLPRAPGASGPHGLAGTAGGGRYDHATAIEILSHPGRRPWLERWGLPAGVGVALGLTAVAVLLVRRLRRAG